MEAVALALTSTTCAGAVKPERVNVTSYIPRGETAERELASPVGDGHLPAARRVPRFHGDAGENAARGVGNRPGDRRVLGVGNAGRVHDGSENQHQRKESRSVIAKCQHLSLHLSLENPTACFVWNRGIVKFQGACAVCCW